MNDMNDKIETQEQLAAALREWLAAKYAIGVQMGAIGLLDLEIRLATNVEEGGMELSWPLVIDGQAIAWVDGKLTQRTCTVL